MNAATLLIRPATLRDLAAVDALLARAYPALLKADYPPSVLVTAVPRLVRAQPRLLDSGTYYVAELDGVLVGAGGWSSTRGGRASIRHVATDPRQVRRGIGRALMQHVADAAREAGISSLDCLSTRTAVPFYTACGFVRLGAIEAQLAPGIAFWVERMHRAV